VQKIDLQGGSEWRFEVPVEKELKLKLIEGTAEIFGRELAIGEEHVFVGQKAAIYSWHGCTVEYIGKDVSEYSSDETPMAAYANLHFALESVRNQTNTGPNVMVVGPANSGKTSLCKILTSYATKSGRTPMLVNLDPTEGVFSVPGGLTATPISDILDIEEGWGSSETSGPSPIQPGVPLSYFYGLSSPQTNTRYYKYVVSRLALGVTARLEKDQAVRKSGLIIDTPSSIIEKDGHDTISAIISDFAVSVVVVVGHERLYSDLIKRFKDKKNIDVLKVAKSGGCVDRDPAYIRAMQSRCIRDYFYGTRAQALSPYTITVPAKHVTVFRVSEEDSLQNLSLLPIGDERETASANTAADREFLVKLEPPLSIIQNCVMAVLNATPTDTQDALVQSEVLGFVHV
jgi:polyribonucleotide 5'-hydroxyl-kinase